MYGKPWPMGENEHSQQKHVRKIKAEMNELQKRVVDLQAIMLSMKHDNNPAYLRLQVSYEYAWW